MVKIDKKQKLTVANIKYSKLGLNRLSQLFVSKSSSSTVDKNAFQNPQLAIFEARWVQALTTQIT